MTDYGMNETYVDITEWRSPASGRDTRDGLDGLHLMLEQFGSEISNVHRNKDPTK